MSLCSSPLRERTTHERVQKSSLHVANLSGPFRWQCRVKCIKGLNREGFHNTWVFKTFLMWSMCTYSLFKCLDKQSKMLWYLKITNFVVTRVIYLLFGKILYSNYSGGLTWIYLLCIFLKFGCVSGYEGWQREAEDLPVFLFHLLCGPWF